MAATPLKRKRLSHFQTERESYDPIRSAPRVAHSQPG